MKKTTNIENRHNKSNIIRNITRAISKNVRQMVIQEKTTANDKNMNNNNDKD